jgi:hypothetical protein
MKKSNLIKSAAISLTLLTYSIGIDAFLAGRTEVISLQLKLSVANSLAVILGSIIFTFSPPLRLNLISKNY